MGRATNPDRFLTAEESAAVGEAVAGAEAGTSAEIKVVIVRHCWDDLRRKAISIFKKHKLHLTGERNCVLILLVTTNREFLIYGDAGINEKAGQGFWEDVRDKMAEHFKADRFGEGLCEGIEAVGEKLGVHFPPKANDVNEISDEIVHEE